MQPVSHLHPIPWHAPSQPQPSSCSVLLPRHLIPPQAGLSDFSESPASHFSRTLFPAPSPVPTPAVPALFLPLPPAASCLQLPECNTACWSHLHLPPRPVPGPALTRQDLLTLYEVSCHWLTTAQDSAPSASTSAIAADRRLSELSPGNGGGRFTGKSLDSPTGKRKANPVGEVGKVSPVQ